MKKYPKLLREKDLFVKGEDYKKAKVYWKEIPQLVREGKIVPAFRYFVWVYSQNKQGNTIKRKKYKWLPNPLPK